MKLSSLVLICAVACGGGNASTQQTVGAAGGTLQAGAATLTIPAGALATDTQITLREAEPEHAGRAKRVEIEPSGRSLSQAARVSIRVDDSNVKVKMHGSDDGLLDVEVEDRNHGEFKTSLGTLGAVEVELEHGAACTAACASGQECDDGVCKAHGGGDGGARTCSPVCASGLECDDGACKTHGEVEGGDGTTCTPACASGLECDDGVCKAHHG